MNDCRIRRALPADRSPVQRMLELYQHDLSDIWDQDLDVNGEYGYALDRYWDTAGHHAFVALANGRYAGFALVNRAVRLGTEGWWMDQFFVLRKYRRQGVGQTLAGAVFAALPGRWEVGQMPANQAAQAFWRRSVGEHAAGPFEEVQHTSPAWHGVVQVFRIEAASAAPSAELQVQTPHPMRRKVLASIESADGSHCVDVFTREDGSFGFEEFRGEADGAARWQPLGRYPSLRFVSGEAALAEAKKRIPWLAPSESWRW